jgi:predicted adenylyl cyclase CyaB
MQNIEFKAELRDFEAARRQCQVLGAKFVGVLRQTDMYYRLTDGRLKRRESSGEPVQWIFYHRPDRVSPRMSNFTILSEEQARRRWGTHSLKPWVAVSKTRELWMLGDVRIHLDQVVDLGGFLEFEAKVSGSFDVKACHAAVANLREVFGPLLGEPISVSYSDLMHQLATEKA